LITSLWCSIILLLVWVVITSVMIPDYANLIASGAEKAALEAGRAPDVTRQLAESRKMVDGSPVIFIAGSMIPMLVGALTSVVSAVGLQKRVAPEP
jgi:hypothetical protein